MPSLAEQIDAAATPSLFEQIDEAAGLSLAAQIDAAAQPTSSAVGDFAKRVGKSLVEGTGAALIGINRLNQRLGGGGLVGGDPMVMARNIQTARLPEAEQYAQSNLDPFAELAAEYHPDPKRDNEVMSTVAAIMGNMAPVLGSGPMAPLTAAAQIAEMERKRGVAEGDKPDVVEARFNLGAVSAAPLAFLPVNVARPGAQAVEQFLTKTTLGAAGGYGSDIALQAVQSRPIDQKQALLSAGIGAGVGAVVGAAAAREANLARTLEQAAVERARSLAGQQIAEVETARRMAAEAAQVAEVKRIMETERLSKVFEEAKVEVLQREMVQNQIPMQENIVLETPTGAKDIRLDVAGEPAVRERARIEAERAAAVPSVDEGAIPPTTELSTQASGMLGMEGWADDVIRRRGPGSGALNTLDPELMAAYSVKGGAIIGRGVKDFATWSGEMAKEFGQDVTPHLQEVWKQSQDPAAIAARAGALAGGIQAKLELPAFKAWFGNSKVVDAQGKPMVVYHGTGASFDTFFTTGSLDIGAHFSEGVNSANFFTVRHSDKWIPEWRAGVTEHQGAVMPVYLSIKNPIKMRDRGKWDRSDVANELQRLGVQDYWDAIKGIRAAEEVAQNKHPLGWDSGVMQNEGIVAHLKSLGYDGVQYLNRHEVVKEGEKAIPDARLDEIKKEARQYSSNKLSDAEFKKRFPDAEMAWIAFDPTQIKSATGNRGTFDPANPDITGAINMAVLSSLAQMTVGSGGGFAWGYYKGKDLPPEERITNALIWSVFGGTVMSPLRNVFYNAIKNAKIPVGGSKHFGGAEYFHIFQGEALKGVFDVIKNESAETAAIAMDALRAHTDWSKRMEKATVGDRVSANNFMRGQGSSGNIIDPELKLAAEKTRAAIDDFTLDLKGMGIIAPGSDLDAVSTANLGSYLIRAYKAFQVSNYKPEQAHIDTFVREYIADQLLNRSTKPIDELRTEGLETAYRMVAKGQGGVLDNATEFAIGNGIARTDGSFFKPRKNLSDATRKLLGEIDDPVMAAGQTIDRMAHFIGASITQTKMREVGLQLGLFSEHATDTHTKPMTVGGKTPSRGPLAGLWVLPEVSDALKSDAAYHSSSLFWRGLATLTAYSKLSKTVGNLPSYAPNFWSSIFNMVGQGTGVRAVMHPDKVLLNALRVTLEDVFPSNQATVQRDTKYLVSKGILRQNVNLNDMVDHMRMVLGAPPNSLYQQSLTGARKVLNGTGKTFLNIYGKFEEFPRTLGFYGEVERYRNVFPNMPEAELYERAADVVRKVYPNALETPDVLRKLSLTGAVNPFVSWTHETLWRNPMNTFKVAQADIKEGIATGNKRLIAAGAARASWWIGAVGGALAINEAMKYRNGVSDRQEEAVKRMLPRWDQNGLLIIKDLTPDQVAYANQSYLLPHSLPAAAIKAGLAGVSPDEALFKFGKEFASNYWGGGGTMLGPLIQDMFVGRNEFGRQLYQQDAGKYFNVNSIKPGIKQDAALAAQQWTERTLKFANDAYLPGTVNEVVKWKRAFSDEVGPDGQLYNKEDLANRLIGFRLQRLQLPRLVERAAKNFGGRLTTISEQYNRVVRDETSKPADIDSAYERFEQGRQRVYADVKTYLQDGIELGQPREKIIKNLRAGGVPPDIILGAVSGFYVAGKKGKEPSVTERFEIIQAMPEAKKEVAWNFLNEIDPRTLKAMTPLRREAESPIQLTEQDQLLLSMSVPNGDRAKNVIRLLSLQKDQNSKAELKEHFMWARVINGQVMEQLEDEQTQAEAKVGWKPDPTPVQPKQEPVAQPIQLPANGKTSMNWKEGARYRDKVTGVTRTYRQGQFA